MPVCFMDLGGTSNNSATQYFKGSLLGKPSRKKSAVFLKKIFYIGPPPKSSKCPFVFGEGGAGSENLI